MLDGMFGYNTYDFEARAYDPTISRFTTMDPLAEKYYSISPYAYCNNNPVNFVDPTGMDWYYGATGGFIYKDDKETDNIRIVNNYEQQIARLSSASSSGSIDKSQLSSIGIENADLSAKAYSNIFTDILSKMEDVNVKELANGKVGVAIFDGNSKDLDLKDRSNTNVTEYDETASHQGERGKSLVTANIVVGDKNDNRFLYSTVSNVQSLLGAHELLGHGSPEGRGNEPYTYDFQKKHSSWPKTTQSFKIFIQGIINKNGY